MVHRCVAFGCKSNFVKGGPVSFHRFPADELRKKLWLIKIRRANFTPSKFSQICSEHFTPDSFDTTKFGGTWLKKTAVPTLFNFPPDTCIKSDPNTDKLLKEFFERNAVVRPHFEDFIPSKRKTYLGDFTDEDMNNPEDARKVLHMAKSQADESRRKLKTLRRKNLRLEKKVSTLQEQLENTQKQLRLKTAIYGLPKAQQKEKQEIMKEISNSGSIECET